MTNMSMHPNELPVDQPLVRRLVDATFPEYRDLALTPLRDTGSTNRLFRLGDELLVRMPRQPGSGATLQTEQDWVPLMGRALPVEVPEILAVVPATETFSEAWALVRWIDGEMPTRWEPGVADSTDRTRLAADLANVILALRAVEITPTAAEDNRLRWYRGEALAAYDATMQRCLRHCATLEGLDLDLDRVAALWRAALQLPGADRVLPDRWFHADLVAENLLLRDGRLTAVLDFGCLGIGDPTIDLHGAWEVLDDDGRDTFRRALQVDDATWLRGRAWALGIALGALAYYWTSLPSRRRDRLAMARAVLRDAEIHGV